MEPLCCRVFMHVFNPCTQTDTHSTLMTEFVCVNVWSQERRWVFLFSLPSLGGWLLKKDTADVPLGLKTTDALFVSCQTGDKMPEEGEEDLKLLQRSETGTNTLNTNAGEVCQPLVWCVSVIWSSAVNPFTTLIFLYLSCSSLKKAFLQHSHDHSYTKGFTGSCYLSSCPLTS